MLKEEQIEIKRNKPVEVGDFVRVEIPYVLHFTKVQGRGKSKTETSHSEIRTFHVEGRVLFISETLYGVATGSTRIPVEVSRKYNYDVFHDLSKSRAYGESCISVPGNYVFPTFYECGVDPFAKEKPRITFYNQDLESILLRVGWEVSSDGTIRSKTKLAGEDWRGVNFNPYVVDLTGTRQYYQRGLVWTLEQKQLLLDSIYNEIEIGKFLFRHNSWERMTKEKEETGERYSFDCVDGKQRLHAIVEFLHNKYPDSNGNYWRDLSIKACRRFLRFSYLAYGELSESATDEDVIDNFLTLNFTGTPMSKEHIEYVKSFKVGRS